MQDPKSYTDQYKEQADSHIKFLIYHVIVIFTIVFTLSNGVNNIQGSRVNAMVDSVNNLKQISGTYPQSLDQYSLLREMYFKSKLEAVKDTAATPVTDTLYSKSAKDSAARTQEKIVAELEKEYADNFSFKLSFLGDINVDMRTWIFVLPYLLLLTLIYIFINDYKILLLKAQAKDTGGPIPLTNQYPFRYLRVIILLIEAILLLVYKNLLFTFFQYSEGLLKDLVFYSFILTYYFGLIYCVQTARRLDGEAGIPLLESLWIYRGIRWTWKTFLNLLSRIPWRLLTGTGQLLMFLTLFLVVTYNSCNDTGTYDPSLALRGYQLFPIAHSWEGFSIVERLFYKYLYIACILFALIAMVWYVNKPRPITRSLSVITGMFFLLATLIYSAYFGLNEMLFEEMAIWIGMAGFLYWYIWVLKKKKRSYQLLSANDLSGYVILQLPLIIFSIVHCISLFHYRNGWIFLYISTWLLSLSLFFRGEELVSEVAK